MKNICLTFIFISSIFAVIHRVPHDRETIQDGIDAAEPGDTVLVDEGTYYESLLITKEITLASYYILDNQLSHRDATIIDCHPDQIGENASCVFIRPTSSGEVISPNLIGFTIQNGVGELVTEAIETVDGGYNDSYYIGGGVAVDYCTPVIKYNYIRNNGVAEMADGGGRTGRGGAAAINNDDNVSFVEDRNGQYPTTQLTRDDLIVMTNNIFENNFASSGSSVSAYGFSGEVRLDSSVYDVYSEEYDGVSEYWVKSTDGTTTNVASSGTYEAITDGVYVSPGGSNDNDGTSSSPFLTIDHAFSRVYGNAEHPVTVHLLDGEYSASSTGEIFPINMVRCVLLEGSGMDNTVLDGAGTEKSIISIFKTDNVTVSSLSVTGGGGNRGGGINIMYGSASITNVRVFNNYGNKAGGIFIYLSDPVLTNVVVENNSRRGIYINWSTPVLYDCVVTNNVSQGAGIGANGGGILALYSELTMIGGEISYNTTGNKGAGMEFRDSGGYLSGIKIHNNSGGLEEYWAHGGGGINLENSSPTIVDSEIYENHACAGMSAYCSGGGIRWKHGVGDPILINVLVRDNTAHHHAGLWLDKPTLINVTVVNNNSASASGITAGSQVSMNGGSIKNSIIRGGSTPSLTQVVGDDRVEHQNVSYSNIQGGNIGEGNTSGDPEFSGNYEATSSECLDAGDPNLWYNEEDGSRSDMGWTGGPYYYTTFNDVLLEPVDEYNFGMVGGMGSLANWRLHNFRDSDIVITGVDFGTSSFTTDVELPITISTHQAGLVPIHANNSAGNDVEDLLSITSSQLASGTGINLSMAHSDLDYALNGGLPSFVQQAEYTVLGDIVVDAGNSSYIAPGTKFLFDGPYSFKVSGTVNIDGAEGDSVYFMNSDPNASDDTKWLGILLDGASSSSSINYARITGVVRNDEVDPENIHYGFALRIELSSPSLSNLLVDNNLKGIRLTTSNATLDNVNVFNTVNSLLMYESSFPVVSNSKFNHNTGLNVYITEGSAPVFNNCEFSYNSHMGSPYGGAGVKSSSGGGVTFNSCKFQYNQQSGEGSAFAHARNNSGSAQFNNCLITNNEVHNPYNGRGGAISIFTNTAVFIRNTTIADNFTYSDNLDRELGAGISIASQLYSGPSLTYPKVAFINNIIYGNEVVFSDGSTEYNQFVFSTGFIETGYEEWNGLPQGMSTLVFSHNNIQGGLDNFQWGSMDYYSPSEFIYWLDGNIDVDPQFNDDYTLSEYSPVIDQGTEVLYMEPWEDPWDSDWYQYYHNWDTWGGVGVPAYMNLPGDWDQYVIAYSDPSEYNSWAPDMGAFESIYVAPSSDISVNPEELSVESFTGELFSEILTISNEEGTLSLDWELSIDEQPIRNNTGNSSRNVLQLKTNGANHDDIKMLDEYNERKFQEMLESGRQSVASSFRELEQMLAEARDHDFVPGEGVRGDLIIYMYDSYGDGWNGNELCIGVDCFGFSTGTYAEASLYLDHGSYSVTCDGGSWQSEVSWEIVDASNGGILLSGGAPYSGELVIADETPECDGTLVEISCDGGSWQGEVSWSITGDDGNEVTGGAPYFEHVCLDPQAYSVYGHDTYGDGWNGNYLTVADDETGYVYLDFTIDSGSEGSASFTIEGPPPEITWISSDITSGTVPPGSTQDAVLTFDATELALGDYVADIVIYSNDPDENPVTIPVTLSIVDQIPGCTDPEATNYNPDANVNDGSCEYSPVPSEIVVSYSTGWNMVGLPLEVEDGSYQALFPNAQSNSLYSFDGIYQSQETLELGAGYLLRLTTDDPVTFTGTPINEITVSLSAGWNLFTGISSSLSVDDVYAQDIIQSGTIYGLDGIYFSPESIEPGKGYWVRATEDGEVTLSSGASAKQVSFVNRAEDANSISFSNGVYSTKLYFGVDIPEEEILSYSLPPMFPEMAFDVRFVGDSRVVMESGEIEVLNIAETLTLSYDVPIEAGEQMNWVLTAEDGTDYILEGAGELTLSSEERFMLNRVSVMPEIFTLHQNFPNPFNPVTTLRYDLPDQAFVTLMVYDMLGREITQLVNTTQEPGFKSVHWDATDNMGRAVSAGVYLYQIEAGEFSQTRKMVLLK